MTTNDVDVKIRHAKRQNAQNLDLSNMQLEYLPVSLFSLKSVLNLNLANNKLTEVDIMIENMMNLTELNLENNNIETLPSEILNLVNLSKVNLNGNPIAKKFRDYKYNWKQSVRDFLKGGGENLDLNLKEELAGLNLGYKEKEIISNVNIGKIESDLKSYEKIENKSESRKSPFNFNMNNNKLTNTSTSFNFKKKESTASNDNSNVTSDNIPKCNIFDQSGGSLKNSYNYNNVFSNNNSSSLTGSINSEININNKENPVKLSTGNFSKLNKKIALDSLIKKKPQTANNNSTLHSQQNSAKLSQIVKKEKIKISDEEKYVFDDKLHLPNDSEENLHNKISDYEIEITKLKHINDKIENDYQMQIKKLEDEIKYLKNLNSNGNLNNSKIISNSTGIQQTVVTNKRNWMENNDSHTNVNNLNPSASTFNINSNSDDIDKIKETESQLQKEVQTNKRLKNEIERLTQQINSNKNNLSGENLLKNVQEINYEEIELSDKIGQGGFSMIYKGTWNYLQVAVKIIFDPNVTEELLAEFNNEIKMLFLLRHPNIILLLGISSKPQKLAIITEYVGNGSLFDLLHRSNKEVNTQTKMKIISQLVRTFNYIHQNGIVHRDIKSHNVLVDENMNIKVCDFGLATYKSDLRWGSGQFAGTPAYMAPELFMKKAYDEKIDIFAFGTMMWEILVRKVPYEGNEVIEIKNKVLSGDQLFIPKTVSEDFGNIIHSCRASDSTKRPSFNELSKLWFDMIEKKK